MEHLAPLAYAPGELSSCGSEPIRYCGAIQSFGTLLAFDVRSESVVAASLNCEQLFHRPLSDILTANIRSLVELPVDVLSPPLPTAPCHFAFDSPDAKSLFATLTFSRHIDDDVGVIDIEQVSNSDSTSIESILNLQSLVREIDGETALEAVLIQAADQIKLATGFNRVMVYRFESNDDGSVVAEAVGAEFGSFLGLRYPASDIPLPARQLYLSTAYRMIVDVNSASVPVVVSPEVKRSQLDLGLASLRAVSPFHIEYLQNMGVHASFSLPLIVDERLWGLIACHHYSAATYLQPKLRQMCVLTAQIVSGRIRDHISARRLTARNAILELSQSLLKTITDGLTATDSFAAHQQQLLSMMDSTGVYIRIGNDECFIGQTPDEEHTRQLHRHLMSIGQGKLIQSLSIAEDWELPVTRNGVGVMAVPLSIGFNDVIIWFRPEFVREIHWGGDPFGKSPGAHALTPRASFESWSQQVKGKCRHWDQTVVESAEYLLYSIVKVVFDKVYLSLRSNRELASAADLKNEIIASISHEMRSPLGVVLNWTQLLRRGIPSESLLKDGLDAIYRNARIQAQLVDDLLDGARIMSGKLRINVIPDVDASSIINETVGDLASTARIKNIAITCDLLRVVVATDPIRLRQIVFNLLANALKFTPVGGAVGIKLDRVGTSYQISVQDNGIGIAEHHLSNIFDRYSQVRLSDAEHGGLGLGLSIVKALVSLLQGQVVADSDGKGSGSTFVVTLPLVISSTNVADEDGVAAL